MDTRAQLEASVIAAGCSWSNPIWFGRWRIYPGTNYPGARWCYVHDDYDGPPDGRYGYADSVEDCKSDIDWWEEDNATDQQQWAEQAPMENAT